MKLTIEIPDDDFVNPEMTPQEQVEHLFKMHHIRATVSPVEPSFTDVELEEDFTEIREGL
jgi:hypothetical protein